MTRPHLIWVCVGLWAVAMALSAYAFTLEPTGDGFIRGLNRITTFIGWQIAASFLALAAWILSKPLPKGGAVRWAGRLPGWWSVVLLLGIAALVLQAVISDPRPPG